MIQIDAGHHGAIGVKHIHRIQAAAQAHFQYHHINIFAHENIHCGQGVEFEISERNIAACFFDALKRSHDGFIIHRLAVDGDALVKAQQMRARERAHFKAGLLVDLGEKGAHRAFAVGACHHHHRALGLEPHALLHFARARQPHINQAAAVGGFEVCEPIV